MIKNYMRVPGSGVDSLDWMLGILLSIGQNSLHPVMDAGMGGCRFLMFPSLYRVW